MIWIERNALIAHVTAVLRSVGLSLIALVIAGTFGCEGPSAASLSPSGSSLETVADEPKGPASRSSTEAAQIESTTDAVPAEEAEPSPADEGHSVTSEAQPSETSLEETSVAAASSEEKKTKVFSSTRAPARPGEAEKISFDDLVIGLQADVVFRPWMMGDRPKELDGKKVRISGYMHAGADPVKTKEFVLLRNLECKFGPGGQADHLAQIYMKPGITTHYPGKDPIKVEGTLKIEPFTGTDGNTWSLYKIVDSEVVR